MGKTAGRGRQQARTKCVYVCDTIPLVLCAHLRAKNCIPKLYTNAFGDPPPRMQYQNRVKDT